MFSVLDESEKAIVIGSMEEKKFSTEKMIEIIKTINEIVK